MKELLSKNHWYLLAISGGSDSMALCDMLIKDNYQIALAHVNYHHRKESDFEQAMIEDFALKHHLPLFIHQAYYQTEFGNFENWAREERYQFFNDIINKEHFYACLVAHQEDDVLETYFLQLKRGFVSYYGLKRDTVIKGVRIIRPLLNYTKEELEQYCKDNGVPYSFDVTNNDLSLSRNYIRHEIVKKMTLMERRKLIEEIIIKNKKIATYDRKIEALLSDHIDINLIKSLSEEEQYRLIFKMANSYDMGCVLKKERIKQILERLFSHRGNEIIPIDDNYNFIKEYDCLKIVKIEKYNYDITIKKPMIVNNKYIFFDLLNKPERFYIKEDSYPLRITIVSKDDIVKIGKIHKSVNRLFIDEKIPYLKRMYWPKIIDKSGQIIFVPRTSADDEGLYIVKTL